MDIIHWRSLL